MKKMVTALLVLAIAFPNFFFTAKETIPPSKKVEQLFKQKLEVLIKRLDDLQAAAANNKNNKELRSVFFRARISYKQTECLITYYYPHLLRIINGPALPFADGESSLSVQLPHGFQVIEEMLFNDSIKLKPAELQNEIRSLQDVFKSILYQKDPFGFQDKYILDAAGFEVYRMIALGITGYDSPLALYSIPEATAVIGSLSELLNIFLPAAKDGFFAKGLNEHIQAMNGYLGRHKDFNSFDRLYFITVYANPLSKKIIQLKSKLNLTLPSERRILSASAPHLFASKYFSPSGYSPNSEADATPEKIILGKKLFHDAILSVNNKRSCGSCHQPGKAFTDGLPKSMSLDDVNMVARNAPTLWNAAFQPVQFYDSRARFLEHQVFDVLHNPKEMGGSIETIVEEIRKNNEYILLFKKAFSDSPEPVTDDNFTNAIASYLRSLISLDSPFDKYMNGNKTALNENGKKGFNLFMGKARCATCHFVPLFNGVAPPYFGEAESEVIGVPATADTLHPELDKDDGKFNLYPIDILRHSFKTPTLRNISLTAPYMHNGVYKTLEEVIDFYDKGGGYGLGIAPINQTLPQNRLHLSKTEKTQLIAFLQSLSGEAATQEK